MTVTPSAWIPALELTKAEYLMMIRDHNQRAKVTEMVLHGPYMDPGHPFRLAIAEWLKDMNRDEFGTNHH